ncbi:MAG: hypothetical protein GX755_09220 [Syntrophomonadaceae bacterium]|nr:hypothetical protein [Syntrophomonadaceae bacterium]
MSDDGGYQQTGPFNRGLVEWPGVETGIAKEARDWLGLSRKTPRLCTQYSFLGIKVCTKW